MADGLEYRGLRQSEGGGSTVVFLSLLVSSSSLLCISFSSRYSLLITGLWCKQESTATRTGFVILAEPC